MTRNYLLHDAVEGQMTEVRRTQILDDLTNRRRYWVRKEETEERKGGNYSLLIEHKETFISHKFMDLLISSNFILIRLFRINVHELYGMSIWMWCRAMCSKHGKQNKTPVRIVYINIRELILFAPSWRGIFACRYGIRRNLPHITFQADDTALTTLDWILPEFWWNVFWRDIAAITACPNTSNLGKHLPRNIIFN